MGLESHQFAYDVKWLGLHYGQIQELFGSENNLPHSCLVQMNAKQLRKLDLLLSSTLFCRYPKYQKEIAKMREFGCSLELEVISSSQGYKFLSHYVARLICEKKWI